MEKAISFNSLEENSRFPYVEICSVDYVHSNGELAQG